MTGKQFNRRKLSESVDAVVLNATTSGQTQSLSVAALTNTAIAGMLATFPDALRDAIYASLT